MPKYENGIIYKLKHNEDYDDINIYIGSTTNFKNRKNQHKTVCNNEKNKHYNMQIYQFIRDNGGFENWVMIPIEPYSCYSKKELEIRERYHIDLLRPTLNKLIPTKTHKEYYETNEEKLLKKQKEKYENGVIYKLKHNEDYDDINIYIGSTTNFKIRKNNHKNNCINVNNKNYNMQIYQFIRDNGGWKEWVMVAIEQYSCNDKKELQIKERFYIDLFKPTLNKNIPTTTHKEDMKEYFKEYHKQKVICDHCGCEIRKYDLKRHQKSKKCINSTID